MSDEKYEAARDVFLCSRSVLGSFTSDSGLFQILPPPPEAPDLSQARHPFVVQFALPQPMTADEFLPFWRRRRIEYAWVLNAVLRASIQYTGKPRGHSAWVVCPNSDSPHRFEWTNELYLIQGWDVALNNQTQPSSRPLPVKPAAEYFSANPVLSDTLVLPDNFSELLKQVDRLAGTKREQFMRCVQWMYAAGEVWDFNMSSSFMALVQAIEALNDVTYPRSECQACGRDVSPGPTAKFREFVRRYITTDRISDKRLNELYGARSGLSHGSSLAKLDEEPWGIQWSEKEQKETDNYEEVSLIVRNLVVDWLLGR